ncbi:PQQ-dependent sugar dehydrogenase [Gryllotalpicola protaetiae]|uniref:PQQ-dependent sugar dehydrogenase n=1 Tax=Gryllotalpicola protaetiae TaxID=2419771 RepID=A0A387BRS0_9MICO|nr:PQQ-dependent sugar dehydrogenase [Gryllotalpicola protaetiae]
MAGCTQPGEPRPEPTAALPAPTLAPTAQASGSPSAPAPTQHWTVVGDPATLATGLRAPWSIALLPGGDALISERDSGRVLERTVDGATRTAGTVPGVVHQGEGGLLGLAVRPGHPDQLYAYLTTARDNRVVRIPLTGAAGARALGKPEVVLDGLPHGTFHNGGRIAFGPDGMLYVTVGDAGDRDGAQQLGYLGGKILRVTPDGGVPGGNPFPGSPVWSLGHRNPQGIGWASDGTMWAAEFGQDTWDELNVITPGANYGWPVVEGIGHRQGFVDPVAQWSTDEASPSDLAVVGATVFVAGLGGQRLWVADASADHAVTTHSLFAGRFGRLREVVQVAPDTLWVLTNNTDGRGTPRTGDDRLLELTITRTG